LNSRNTYINFFFYISIFLFQSLNYSKVVELLLIEWKNKIIPFSGMIEDESIAQKISQRFNLSRKLIQKIVKYSYHKFDKNIILNSLNNYL